MAADATARRPRIRFELPEGWLGVLLLLVVAALSGGLIATYWPAMLGSSDLGTTQDRLTSLETRVGQLATGRTGAAATGVFGDLRHDVGALGQRLDADEARLAAIEKSSDQAGKPDSGDLAALRQKMDASTAAFNDITQRLTKLEGARNSAADLAPISAKLSVLDGRVGTLEADIARSGQVLNGTVSGLDSRLKALEANAPPPGLAERLDSFALKTDENAIETRLQALEAQNTGQSLHHAAAMLALAQLAHAAGEPKPFALELDTFAAAEPGDAVIAALQPYAAKGVANQAMLTARFPVVARAALDAERSANAHTFLAQLWANILNLISVRRVGDVVGNDSESRLARAQADLDTGDLAAAANEVRALKGRAANVVAPWLKDADARVRLDRAVAEMSARVIQTLAAMPPQPASPATPQPAQGGRP